MEVPLKDDGTPDYGIYADKDWPEPQKGLATMITLLDATVGQVLDQLEASGRADNSIVMFTSDNGPHGEGGNNPDFFNSNGPLRGIKRDLYEGGIRVPLIVRWPGHAPAGTVSDHPGYFADVLATAADIAGVQEPPATDGLSFLPAILGNEEEQPQHKALYWEFYERGSAQAVRMGRWKGVVQPLGSDNIELYDLSEDIGETNNVAAMHPEVAAKALAAIRKAHVPSPLWKPSGKRQKTAPRKP